LIFYFPTDNFSKNQPTFLIFYFPTDNFTKNQPTIFYFLTIFLSF